MEKIDPKLKVVLASGYVPGEVDSECLLAIKRHLNKPISAIDDLELVDSSHHIYRLTRGAKGRHR